MVHSSTPSEHHKNLHSKIPCEHIYSKEYAHGTLYALVLLKPTAHKTLDRRIVELDNHLMLHTGTMSTKFTSISQIRSGKVKTFGNGEHMIDEHFKAIFSSDHPGGGRELLAHEDVFRWSPPQQTAASSDGKADHPMDISMKEKVQIFRHKLVKKLRTKYEQQKKQTQDSAALKVFL